MKGKCISAFLAVVFAFLTIAVPAFADGKFDGTEKGVRIQINVLKAVNSLRLTKEQVQDLASSLKDLKAEADKLSTERLDLLNKEKDLLLAGKPIGDIEKNISLLENDLKLKIESMANSMRKILTDEQYGKLLRNNRFGFLITGRQQAISGLRTNELRISKSRPVKILEMRINGKPVMPQGKGAGIGIRNFQRLSDSLDMIIKTLDEKGAGMTA